ncbi:MAG: hypothetical protein DMF03_04190 [Verrucomicrobia bacterium]|nr:MAG: hypothetical protein DMF03_04190 [Verrucomicrobiota bacterium]
MNPLATDWPIKRRSDYCHVTQRPFAPGELFYTLLYSDGDGFRREDLSEEMRRRFFGASLRRQMRRPTPVSSWP